MRANSFPSLMVALGLILLGSVNPLFAAEHVESTIQVGSEKLEIVNTWESVELTDQSLETIETQVTRSELHAEQILAIEASTPAPSPASGKTSLWARLKHRLNPKHILPLAVSESVKNTFRQIPQKPSTEEVGIGITMTTWRGVTSSWVWFSQPGISPELAVGLVAFQSTTQFIGSVFGRTMDRVFASRYLHAGPRVSKSMYLLRSQIYSAIITESVKALSSAPGQLWTWDTQLSTLMNLMTVGMGSNLLGAEVSEQFQNTPRLIARFWLVAFAVIAPITVMDLAGHSPIVADFGFYQLRESVLWIIGTYGGIYTALKVLPEQIRKFLEIPDRAMLKLQAWREKFTERLSAGFCGKILRGNRWNF